MTDLNEMDIPMLYKSQLTVLLAYNQHFHDAVLASKICNIEYCMHVAIIVNETLTITTIKVRELNMSHGTQLLLLT